MPRAFSSRRIASARRRISSAEGGSPPVEAAESTALRCSNRSATSCSVTTPFRSSPRSSIASSCASSRAAGPESGSARHGAEHASTMIVVAIQCALRMTNLRASTGDAAPVSSILYARVDFPALLREFLGLFLHAFLQRLRLRDALLLRVFAHVLRDFHRAEVRAAHRAEMRELRAFLRQRLVVEGFRLVGIEPEVELIFPAELEASL